MTRKDKIIIGVCIWIGLGFIFGAYSSFIPNALTGDIVQKYIPYILGGGVIAIWLRKNKKSNEFFFQHRIKVLSEQNRKIGHPFFFYPFAFLVTPIFIAFMSWFILFTQTNVWGQLTSWQKGVEKVEIAEFRRGRSKRALGTTAIWVKNESNDRFRVIIDNYNINTSEGIALEDANYAELQVRKGPLGRFVNQVVLVRSFASE